MAFLCLTRKQLYLIMKILKFALLLTASFSIFACKKKSDIIAANVNVTVLTTDGKNALEAPALYDASNINVYHIVNGQPQLYVAPEIAGRKAFDIVKNAAGKNIIRFYLQYVKNEPTTLTLVKFGNTRMDTIKGEFRFVDASVFCDKVWFNGVSKDIDFSIIK